MNFNYILNGKEEKEMGQNKLVDWKNRLKDRHMLSVVVVLFAIIIAMGVWIYKKQTDYRLASENQYNMAFFELEIGRASCRERV